MAFPPRTTNPLTTLAFVTSSPSCTVTSASSLLAAVTSHSLRPVRPVPGNGDKTSPGAATNFHSIADLVESDRGQTSPREGHGRSERHSGGGRSPRKKSKRGHDALQQSEQEDTTEDEQVDVDGDDQSATADDVIKSRLEGDAVSPDEPNRGRKGRTIYKAQQVYVLEQVFSRTHYPDPEVIESLSKDLDISENKIKVWFQNKRARWRRRVAEVGQQLPGFPSMTPPLAAALPPPFPTLPPQLGPALSPQLPPPLGPLLTSPNTAAPPLGLLQNQPPLPWSPYLQQRHLYGVTSPLLTHGQTLTYLQQLEAAAHQQEALQRQQRGAGTTPTSSGLHLPLI